MAQEVCVVVGAEDRARLTAIVGDRSRPLKHLQRSRIVLFSADRLPVIEVARRAGVSRPAVWRWQRRYAEAGLEGLLRDKTRPPGKAPVAPGTVAEVLALTCAEPPGETTHWTGRAMAKAVGLSLRTIQRIWEKHRLQPHRIRTFKRSTDPAFAERSRTLSASICIRRPVPWCCRSTRNPRSRRSIAPSRVCRSSPASAGP
jgi:transposase